MLSREEASTQNTCENLGTKNELSVVTTLMLNESHIISSCSYLYNNYSETLYIVYHYYYR